MYDKTVRRRRAVLGLLVACSLILLTAYFGQSSGGGLRSVQRGVVEVLSPIQEGTSRALKPFRDLAGWVGDTLNAKGDVKDLRAERNRLRSELITAGNQARENDRLRRLLDLDATVGIAEMGPVTGRVIARSPTVWYSTITVNRGTSDGVAVDQPAVTGEGLVGKVTNVWRDGAQVTLITDHTSGVGGRVVGSGVTGVVSTEVGRPTDLRLDFTGRRRVDRERTVVTAGTQPEARNTPSVYPPGIPIGVITRVENPGTDDQQVYLRPFADMRRLEFVQVLTKVPGGAR